METQASTPTFRHAQGIDVERLEEELNAMWAETTAEREGGTAAGVMRACVLNLIIHAAAQDDRASIDALLGEVIERHPCRAIILFADREHTPARIEAYVSTRCQVSSKGAKQICGEQITIEACGAAVETVSTAVAPLLIPDVPVFLWWKDIPHYEEKLFTRLVEMADRVIIDSASFDHPHEDMRRLAALLNERRGQIHLSDLNWGRLTSWRSLVAAFWDIEDYRPSLQNVVRVEVEYDPPDKAHDETAPKVLLAIGWLASRLKWKIERAIREEKSHETRLIFRAGERTLEVLLRETTDRQGQDGLITALRFFAADGKEFSVVLRPEGNKLETCARVGGGEYNLVRVLNYEARTEGRRLSGELEFLSRDVIYEQALDAAAEMLEVMKK